MPRTNHAGSLVLCKLAGAFLLFATLCGILIGCSGDEADLVYPVHGQVQLDGKPLPEALVVLHPKAGDRRSLSARTNDAGEFEITTNAPNDGAPAGEYLVTIEYRELVQEGDEAMRIGRNLLPARYADPLTSGLECEVKEQTNELPSWNLSTR